MCVCVFSSHPFWTSSSLDVPAGVTQEEGHTGFLIHLPSAVRALIFVKDIPQIASEDIRNHLPARFDGQDKDLLDAEASIDPLVNNAPPTPSGIDIN